MLKRPDLDFQDLAKAFSIETPDNDIVFDIETNQRYSGYIKRQMDEIEKMKKNRNAHIPSNFDYSNVKGLSAEITQKLSKVEPKTLAQAENSWNHASSNIGANGLPEKKRNRNCR